MSLLAIFSVLGPVTILVGVTMMILALRSRGIGTVPKSTVMLMAGMMATAFGMVLTAFVLGGQPMGATR